LWMKWVKIKIEAQERLNRLKLSGSGDFIIKDFLNQDNLKSSISGSGDIILNGFEGLITSSVKLSGSGDFKANRMARSTTCLP